MFLIYCKSYVQFFVIFSQSSNIKLLFAFCLNQIRHWVPELCSIESDKGEKKIGRNSVLPSRILLHKILFLLYFIVFKGLLHLLPQKAPKLACFVLYLKIIDIFLKNNVCIL